MIMTEQEKKQLEDTADKVDKIYLILVGDETLGQDGLIKEIRELREFKAQIMKMKWYSLGAIGFGALIYTVLKGIKEFFLVS